jgi:pimeloyl-ACP methyl ester carboxylesterase
MHPRLFHSLILIEPVILDSVPPGPNAAMMSSLRRDTFPSRAATEAQMRRNAFFKPFDPRALQAYFAHSLLDRSDGSVVLATPKAQEAWSYVRPNFHPLPADTTTAEARNKERLLDPDLVPFSENSKAVFKRPECVVVMDAMPHLRPRTFFMFGDFSYINYEEAREKLVARTGTGRGGNGGVADGGVEVKVVDDAGHLCCFEKPTVMAADMAVWLDKEMARWRREKEFWATYDREVSKNGGKELSEKWMQGVKQESTLQRPVANDGSKL